MIRVRTESPVYGGFTIARGDAAGDEGVVFVKGALPGEMVDAVVSEKKRDYSVATVSEVLEPSELRVEPFCPHFGVFDCGGCHLQHASYAGQVIMKNAIIKDSFKRIGGIEIEPAPPVTGPDTHYRHRAQFKVASGGIGFFREGSRDVVPIDECPLLAPGINEALQKIRRMPLEGVKEAHVTLGYKAEKPAGPEGSDFSGAPEAGLFEGEPSGLSVLLKGRGFDEVLSREYADAGFDTVFFDDGSHSGRGFVSFDLGGFRYSVSPLSFFQSNWSLNLKAVEAVKEMLGLSSGGTLLDIYAGGGNFSIPMSPSAKRITCVEENGPSVKDGIRNLELNGIKNMKFIRTSFEKLQGKGQGANAFDAVIVDPPRPGLSREAAKNLLQLQTEKILYISCNPATLARDVKKLSERFRVESVRLVDFFPHTYHIEVLCLLARS